MKFSIKNFSCKCDQIRRKWRICSHLLHFLCSEHNTIVEKQLAQDKRPELTDLSDSVSDIQDRYKKSKKWI